MSDIPNLIVSGDSREAVAYALLLGIAQQEKKTIHFQGATPTIQADAEWLLSTYLRCWMTVSGSKV